MGLRPTQANENGFHQFLCPFLTELSSRPERSAVEGPAVQRTSPENFFDRAYSDFLLRAASDNHGCGTPKREPYARPQRHDSQREPHAPSPKNKSPCLQGLLPTPNLLSHVPHQPLPQLLRNTILQHSRLRHRNFRNINRSRS